MPKIPKRPEDIIDDLARDYRETYGFDIIAIILYGSGARGEYVPKKSDINFMIVVTENGINALSKAVPLVAKWHKRHVSTPLFLTQAYIVSSLDVFPIEFLNMQAAYKVVYGDDVLQDLVFEKRYVRLQCERELKGKLLQLRENFLGTEGKRRSIETLIAASLPTFLSLFQAVLFLKERKPASDKRNLITAVAEETGGKGTLFSNLIGIKAIWV